MGIGLGTVIILPTIAVLVVSRLLTAQFYGGAGTFARWVAFYLCVGISEELLFRGFVFQRLINGLGLWQGQVICAAMFLMAHLANSGLYGVPMLIGSLNLILFSLTMGYVALKTGSLAAPIGFHAAANLMQGGVLGLGTSRLFGGQGLFQTSLSGPMWLTGGAFGLEGSVVYVVTLLLIAAVIWLSLQLRRVNRLQGNT